MFKSKEIEIPKNWDMIIFKHVSGKPFYDYLNFSLPQKFIMSGEDFIYHCVLLKRNFWNKLESHDLFEIKLVDPHSYIRHMLEEGYMGLLCKQTIDGYSHDYITQIYAQMIGEENGDNTFKRRFGKFIKNICGYFKLH